MKKFYVFEIELPGTWLNELEDGTAHDVRTLLYHAQSCLADAALSLSLFEAARVDGRQDWESSHERSERDGERRRAKEMQLEAELSRDLSAEERWEASHKVRYLAEVAVRRDSWGAGELPDTYRSRLPFLHARSFVTALESIRKAFEAMKELPGVPSAVAEIVQRIDDDIPAMKHVRDSIQHGEDRVRGLMRGKPIELKPVDNELVSAPGGVVIYDALNGTRFGCTLADGEYGEVDISAATAARVAAELQEVVEAFHWHGPREHAPR